jgi:5,10-methylenetetrahydromethanopterin reductase
MPMKRLGLSFGWREKSLGNIVSCCRVAEEAGLESVWIPEAWGRDAFLALAAIANATQHIKLATGIINVYSRSPAAIAMGAATLEELSNGRAILGIGSSGAMVVERWHGLHFEQPFTRLRESITIVRQVLSGSPVSLQGKVFQVSDFRLAVYPPTRKIPVYLAALGPKMLRLAGEVADGALLYLQPLSKIRDAIAEIRKGAERANRPSESVDVAAFLPTFISEKAEEAKQIVARAIAYYVGGMGTYYHRKVSESGFKAEADSIRAAWLRGDRAIATKEVSTELIDSVALAGPFEECRTKLEEFRKAGVNLPILSVSIEDKSMRQAVYDSIRSMAAE